MSLRCYEQQTYSIRVLGLQSSRAFGLQRLAILIPLKKKSLNFYQHFVFLGFDPGPGLGCEGGVIFMHMKS
jgi:hypothetical protein